MANSQLDEDFAAACEMVQAEEWERALVLFKDVRRRLVESGMLRQAAICDLNMGAVFESLGQYESSLEHLLRALAVFRQFDMTEEIADCNLNIGVVHEVVGDMQASLDAYAEAMHAYLKLDLKVQVGVCHMNIGAVQERLEQYAPARHSFAKALQLFTDTCMPEYVDSARRALYRLELNL